MKPEHEAIIKDLQRVILEEWSAEDKNEFFLTGIGNDDTMAQYHTTLGRWIRNNYNLWELPWDPELKDGIDWSPEHPDCISDTLLKELYSRGLPQKETT